MGSGLSKKSTGPAKSPSAATAGNAVYPRASILTTSNSSLNNRRASVSSAKEATSPNEDQDAVTSPDGGVTDPSKSENGKPSPSPSGAGPILIKKGSNGNDIAAMASSAGSTSSGNPMSPTSPSSLSPSSFTGKSFTNSSSGRKGSASEKLHKLVDIDDAIQKLLDAGVSGKIAKSFCLKNAEVIAICNAAREVFLTQPALIELSAPVKIVGDVHGQYTDLLRLFEMCGYPPYANFLFMGDYVDRGKQSLETILLLLCYKIKYPENFFLLRGNHECANVTRVYGFYDECKRRTTIKLWKTFIDVFNTLPIAAVVAGKIFCVHGGLSPSLNSMDDIRAVERPTDVPDFGLLNDLLWSDPSETATDWEDNERGVSYCFGRTIIEEFLRRHDFDLVCRAHMVVEDGYEFFDNRSLVTVFSAPNYCGEFDNFGAVMCVGEDLLCSFELLKPLELPAQRPGAKGPLGNPRRRPSPPMMGMAASQAAAAAAREAREAARA